MDNPYLSVCLHNVSFRETPPVFVFPSPFVCLPFSVCLLVCLVNRRCRREFCVRKQTAAVALSLPSCTRGQGWTTLTRRATRHILLYIVFTLIITLYLMLVTSSSSSSTLRCSIDLGPKKCPPSLLGAKGGATLLEGYRGKWGRMT